MCTKYAEVTLAVHYREKSPTGEYLGGPMYYIKNGLSKNWHFLALGIGSGIVNLIIGISIAGIVALVLLGGINRIGTVTERLVPFMALFYLILSLGVVIIKIKAIPSVFAAIIGGAFTPKSFTGGIIGSMFLSMKRGVSRGIFSNEAGLGTGSIAHACSDTDNPVKQGMFGIFEVFADTIVVCTLTALVILSSGITVNYGTAAGAICCFAF
ncbi:MAG: alanine:cation symporter family protein [Treponema sp.]|nr:alanine:cation symporter family protein [Candidatus Treponema caballi]